MNESYFSAGKILILVLLSFFSVVGVLILNSHGEFGNFSIIFLCGLYIFEFLWVNFFLFKIHKMVKMF